ncbi:MAG: HAD-IA family hydrolase [Anaeromyxobacter sp.]|nr:HAD-IA family hydrolase [Anaeromyxobacter sp.]MBL0277993.1 HAD-IA family hydrolase [Anaeromyxobacter sp.]
MSAAAPARPIAVLLDLDGTLVDTVPFILAAVRHAFQGYGRCPTDAEWIAGIGTPLRDQLASFARQPDDVPALFDRYRAYWLQHHDAMTRLFPGAGEAVRALRAAGHPLAIITAKIEAGAERTLRHVGLRDQVDLVVAADTVARCKPDPMPVRHALERLGRTPAEAVMIGDSNHDLAAGRAAGTATAGVLWGAASREVLAPLADHLLDDPRQIVPLVARLQAARPAG